MLLTFLRTHSPVYQVLEEPVDPSLIPTEHHEALGWLATLATDTMLPLHDVFTTKTLWASLRPRSLEELDRMRSVADYWMLPKDLSVDRLQLEQNVRGPLSVESLPARLTAPLDMYKTMISTWGAGSWGTFLMAYFGQLPHTTTWFSFLSRLFQPSRPSSSELVQMIGLIVSDRWEHIKYYTDPYLCSVVAYYGHLSRLQRLRANGCQWDTWTCAYAAKGGHLEVLQWALDNGCPWDANTCSEAAKEGHLEVLQWARANGCPWDTWTCANAAWNGHLEILQWARANGCPWNESISANAAWNGHLEILQWACANGCPWNRLAYLRASTKYPAIYNWILTQPAI